MITGSETSWLSELVPEQRQGRSADFFLAIAFASPEAARPGFGQARQRLLAAYVNGRNKLANGLRGFGAVLGARLGLEALQWNSFLEGLLAGPIE